ncbi:MAG: hypothetical protein H7Y31_10555 [Chitinophagaceae bacterium]|nr:hypothetical protein [Chitinophagaceae bacterium]
MRKILVCAAAFALPFLLPACTGKAVAEPIVLIYDTVPVSKLVTPIINEGSGIADSKKNPGHIWVEEDSGNPPQLHLLSHDGTVKNTVHIAGATNRDWEDIALSNGKIYIGEIGDNGRVFTDYAFYRFDEPTATTDTVRTIEKISFSYPDGPHDAEGFIVDPISKNIYIITKRDMPSRIYVLKDPFSTTTIAVAELVGTLPYAGVVSAAISANGSELLIKTYMAIQYYRRTAGQTVADALKSKSTTLGYKQEPLGEAIAFALKGGFFTLSEKGFASSVNLFYYPKK